jgi:trimeric autotransporter adhesin
MKLMKGVLLVLLSFIMVACGGSDDKKVSISVSPMTATIKAGTTQALSASSDQCRFTRG